MQHMTKYFKPHIFAILLTFGIKFVGTYLDIWIPSLMEVMLDEKVPSGELSSIYRYGLLMLLCALGCMVLNITANALASFTAGKITKKIRRDLFSKVQSLSARQMDKLTIASAESRLTSDTYHINQLLTRIQRMGIRAPILLIGGIIMLVQMDWVMALVLVILLPIISLLVYHITRHGNRLFVKKQTKLDSIVQVLQENISGVRVIKALSKGEYEKERFENVNGEFADISLKAGKVTSITGPVTSTVLHVGLTAVVVVGAIRVNAGAIRPGVIIAALQYFTMILNAMSGITRIFIMWSQSQASAIRVAEVLALPEDMQVQPAEATQETADHIVFDKVNFSYTGVGKNLSDLSFRLGHGQTLGILGATGSGKSTIANLLLRLYDLDSGKILLDGQDVRAIDKDTLRKKFGVVFQNDFLMEGTVADNIRFFRDIPEERVKRAAACAQAGFIWEKGGLDAPVAIAGNNLSGGQKQRLLIARALASDPEILVLDDASSALDYQTDAAFRRALREHYRNTTTVLVTQRVSSLRHADLILVMEEGLIIGMGDHDTLMETCEEYRLIAKTQMGDGKEGAV